MVSQNPQHGGVPWILQNATLVFLPRVGRLEAHARGKQVRQQWGAQRRPDGVQGGGSLLISSSNTTYLMIFPHGHWMSASIKTWAWVCCLGTLVQFGSKQGSPGPAGFDAWFLVDNFSGTTLRNPLPYRRAI